MLNWKFVGAQFKNTWIVILGFGLGLTVLVGLVNISKTFASIQTKYLLENTLFGFGSLLIFISFGAAMSIIMINNDINRGYIGSWLTSTMSRTKIFNSKLFVLIISVLIINLWIIVAEMISFNIRMPDVRDYLGRLLLGNLTLFCYSLMICSGTWLICCLFQNNHISLGIIIALGAWFLLCVIMIQLSQEGENENLPKNLKNLKYFKYFTIQTLFNSPIQVKDINASHLEFEPLKVLDFAWQLPLMFGTSVGFYTGAQFIVRKKDFNF